MVHPAKQWYNEKLGQRTVEALKENRFDAVYAANAAEACQAVLAMIPEGSTIGFGGSMTLGEIGLIDKIKDGPFNPINPPYLEADLAPAERRAVRLQAMQVDVYITGTNAVTVDGELVNVDATGNRLAGMMWGPTKSIVVVGVNKITHSLGEALDRVSNVAGPANAKRLRLDTPCAVTGECSDCRSPQRICNATLILQRKPGGTALTVVVVGEDLGF